MNKYLLKENEFFLNKNSLDFLIYKLKVADRDLIPKVRINSKGEKEYHYKKTNFSPNLSLLEIEDLINHPTDFDKENKFIINIVNLLSNIDVSILLVNFKNNNIAGQWIPRDKLVMLNLNLIESGTTNFAKVLNHEVIHIAQSCNNGNISSKPKKIGLNLKLNKEINYLLSSKIYKNISLMEQRFEKEAYSYQDNLSMGINLIKKYCI